MQTHLILIGYRATGKTTLARLLAERLGTEAIDSDVLIERRAGKSIARIFAEEGESVFRDREAEEIAKVFSERNDGKKIVLASGGGAVLRQTTRELFRNRGQVIWLKASPETILERMSRDSATPSQRPGLTNLSAREEIEDLLQKRSPIYEEAAHLHIDTESASLEHLAEKILAALREKTG